MSESPCLYGLLAEFEEPEALLAATRQARRAGYRELSAYSPFPVEGLAPLVGQRRNHLPWLSLAGGLGGALAAYALQYYAAVIAYPYQVGGRPLNSWPAFMPVTITVALLVAGLVTVGAMLWLNGLPQPYHPLFNVPAFERASRDRFFLCLSTRDPRFEREGSRAFLEGLGARAVWEVPC